MLSDNIVIIDNGHITGTGGNARSTKDSYPEFIRIDIAKDDNRYGSIS